MTIWQFGDHVNTDMLFPGKYTYTCSTAEEIIPHLLEDLDPEFAQKAKPGDILLAGKNFGCGSSREQPVLGLKALDISLVVESASRIFYRAAINQGLLLIECPEAVRAYRKGDDVKIQPAKGQIQINKTIFGFPKFPPEICAIHKAGGLLNYTRQIIKNR